MPGFSWWGSAASVVGVLVSFFGLAWAIRTTGNAQTAAEAAAVAAIEARSEITEVLYFRELEQAIGIIERLKGWHRASKWDLAIEQYPVLRAELASINEHVPKTNSLHGVALSSAISQVRIIEDLVEEALAESATATIEIATLNSQLNMIQTRLQTTTAEPTEYPLPEEAYGHDRPDLRYSQG